MSAAGTVLLAIDTSTRTVGVALYDGSQLIYESAWKSIDYHTVELAPTVEDALRRAALAPGELGALAVALGPGSFTGLRVGMAFAKGLCLVRHLPLVGVHTLDILAASQPILTIPLIGVLRAGRGRLAVGFYEVARNAWKPTGDTEILTITELADRINQPVYLCGELSDDEREQLLHSGAPVTLATPAQSLRRPGFLAEIAWKRWKSGRVEDPAAVVPLYIHYNDPVPE